MESKELNEKVISYLQRNGPSLTVHIAKAINLDMLFAGAVLSELLTDKTLKLSHMKVGSTPVYLLPGQETMLDKFSKHLPSKEKEALNMLKKAGVLEDREQEPAIRVALRSIKDFAIPIKFNKKVYWTDITLNKEQVREILKGPRQPIQKTEPRPQPKPVQIPKPKTKPISVSKTPRVPKITAEQIKQQAERQIEKEIIQETSIEQIKPEIQEQKPKQEQIPKILIPTIKPKKLDAKQKFLKDIQEYLKTRDIELIEIQKHDKKQIIAIIKLNNQEHILVAFNKKRFDESDLLKIYRKHIETETPFYFLSKGEISKKTLETIKASKRLKALGKFE
jgi:hypothetical protein